MAAKTSTLSVCIVSDNIKQVTLIMSDVANISNAEMFAWDQVRASDIEQADILVLDVDIASISNIQRLKQIQNEMVRQPHLIFPIDKRNRRAAAQANALRAKYLIKRPIHAPELIEKVVEICKANKLAVNLQTNVNKSEKQTGAACLAISNLLDEVNSAILKGGKLPVADLRTTSTEVISAVSSSDMAAWLRAVRSYSSYTFRHVMVVTGYSAAFGVMFGMNEKAKNLLTLGALMHDVGKMKVPLQILDKSGRLTEKERAIIRIHPEEGEKILRNDGQLPSEIAVIARSHHELLDGTGYPDQLKGDQIPDVVRIMTVIDIFSALMETRSYKKSMTAKQAYAILVGMGGKLDQDIVRAFEPVAFDEASHSLIEQTIRNVA